MDFTHEKYQTFCIYKKIYKTKYEAAFDILEKKIELISILITFLFLVLLFLTMIIYTNKPKHYQ